MNVMQLEHMNPGATMPLYVPVLVLPNTHEQVVDANITANGKLDIPWLEAVEPHDRVAIICGGGPSLIDSIPELLHIWDNEPDGRFHAFFGLNGASNTLSAYGMPPEYQIIIDAQEITSSLVDRAADTRIYASHVHPETAKYADALFHLSFAGVEDLLPPEKVRAGGYSLVGGGVSVGITALVVAYVMGYRKMHLFGYDSSNRGDATHAYKQAWNESIPGIDVKWAGKTYRASMPMKLQAEAFLRFADQLKDEGVEIEVHGDGLLPAMWRNRPTTEREKYQLLWALGGYGKVAFGEDAVDEFCARTAAPASVVDFGCGTGRPALALAERGYDVRLTDFTDNCREKECLHLPFVQWDLTKPGIPLRGDVGFCTDVMEHIPTDDVDAVIANILAATPRAYFQIATVPDSHGSRIGETLHMTVRPHEWWRAKFPKVLWEKQTPMHSCFYVVPQTEP